MSQELNPQGYNYGVDPVNINPFWEEGGGGSDDYDDLRNRPQINGVTLTGNKTTEQLHLDYTLPTASADTKGGVKIGSGLTMDGDTLNVDEPTPYELPTASANVKGGVKIGSGLSMDGDVLSANEPTPYSLPTASANVKGGVKIGSGLTMDGEVLSADRQLPTGSSQTVGDVLVSNGANGEAWREIDDICLQVPYSDSGDDVGKVLTKIGTNQDQYAWLNAQAAYTDYSNTSSGLSATTVQAAIDELAQGGSGGGGITELVSLTLDLTNPLDTYCKRRVNQDEMATKYTVDVTKPLYVSVDIVPEDGGYMVDNISMVADISMIDASNTDTLKFSGTVSSLNMGLTQGTPVIIDGMLYFYEDGTDIQFGGYDIRLGQLAIDNGNIVYDYINPINLWLSSKAPYIKLSLYQ